MPLSPDEFEEGVRSYWREIGSRPQSVQQREQDYLALPRLYASRQPPRFERAELELIIRWKYTDGRWRDRALDGLAQVTDDRIRDLTANIGQFTAATVATASLRDQILGVGVAGVSAVLAAARPHIFPVIDVFALTAICHYYNPRWLASVSRDEKGRFAPDYRSYEPYTEFCRERATELSAASGQTWTPRRVDMALWAIGKRLIDTDTVRSDCVQKP